MKPRIFIGSSAEGLPIATAVNKILQRVALSKVWSDGVFGLSEPTTKSLKKEIARADFGIFVFTSDDDATIRGKLLAVPRDNVVYELGLFSGALGTDRCFFMTALNSGTHVPTDLLGLTAGTYDAAWPEDEMESAVAPFADEVKKKVRELGFRHTAAHRRLYELVTEFECCDWIREQDVRVAEKQRRFDEMVTFSRKVATNKKTLLEEHRTGAYAAICAAITVNPEQGDDETVRSARLDHVKRGVSQDKFLEAMIALKSAGHLPILKQQEFMAWTTRWHNPDPSIADRGNALRA